MREKTVNVLLLVVSVLVTLLVMEVVLRISGIAAMSARFTCYHPVMGKIYCASTEGSYTKTTYSHHLVINSDGMVDREYPVERAGDSLRVALLGDSFTASEYLPVEDKFEGLLEEELSRELGRPVELLNFAISAIETWNQLQLFHLRAAKYKPDLTFLVFFWGNDIRDNIGQLRAGNPNPLLEEYEAPLAARIRQARKNFNKVLWDSSLLYQVVHDGFGRLERMIKHWLEPGYLKRIDRVMLGNERALAIDGTGPVEDTGFDDDDLFFWGSAGWEITRQLILKLQAGVEATGSRLVVLHFPSDGLIRSGIPLPHREFDAFLEAHGIPRVSLFGDYQSMPAAELQRHFIPGDGHWTRHGHRHVATRVREMLSSALAGP